MPPFTFRLHPTSLAIVGLACFACRVAVPQPPQLTIAIKAHARTPSGGAQIHAESDVSASAEGYENTEVVPVPTEAVALEGADVVEFFGIPLEGAQDLVFVLDRSGSMEELALGQIAQLGYTQPIPSEAPPLAPPPPAADYAQPAADYDPPEAPPSPEPPAAEPPFPESPPQLRKIDVAHTELVVALEQLPVDTRMNLLFFNNHLEALEASITPMREGDRENMIAFVREIFPEGPTALAPAMRTAFLMNAKRIILLSDGLGNVGGDAEAVLRDAREAMRGGVRIDTIGLGQDQNAWLLQTLAHESGGIYQQL